MAIKKTKLLVAELRVIADMQPTEHCRNVLKQAAQRLEDTDGIAWFYWKHLKGDSDVKKRTLLRCLPLFSRNKNNW